MKKFARILAMLMALTLAVSVCATAFAWDGIFPSRSYLRDFYGDNWKTKYDEYCAFYQSFMSANGDPTQNLEAFEAVVRAMKEAGIGYGAINHPIDRDPVCGYTGIIGEVCPRFGRREGEGVPLSKLQKLGLYKNYNSTTIGYHGDPAEEADRQPNTLKIVKK